MKAHLDKKQDRSQRTSDIQLQRNNSQPAFQFIDNRPEALLQRKLQEGANNSPQSQQAAQFQSMADNQAAQQFTIQKKENNTGLPDNLKSGIENLSGYSMDDVKVHYNSSKPAQLQAHAYAQGTDIHLGAGQEKHLPHEAWHVVQQKQGRVKPTMQMKGGVNVNDDKGLEREADVMGGKALQFINNRPKTIIQSKHVNNSLLNPSPISYYQTIQCYGAIRFANLKDSEKYQTKGDEIIASLQATPSIAAFLANKNTLITLEYEPQLATVKVVGDQVQITLSPWFFEQQSRGRILGMLAHEFGVHPLADEAMSPAETAAEVRDITANTAFQTGLPNHTITPQEAGQADHIFASIEGQPRFNSYRQTAYEMALAMLLRSRLPNATVTEGHVTDQIMTYLSDIAMILATNDHRGQIAKEPKRTADAFNYVRSGWIGFLGGQPHGVDLTRLTPNVKTKYNVLREVTSIGGRLILSIGTGSTDNSKTNQTKTGIFNPTYSDLTNVQQGVLVDYGLALQNKNTGTPVPTFMDALDDVRGGNAGINLRLLQAILNHQLPHNDPNVDNDLKALLQRINNNNLETPISTDNLHYISALLNIKILIIKPNGKIETRGNGNAYTLLEVTNPALHYRFAS